MSDTTKTVDLIFNAGGSAAAALKDMLTTTQQLLAAQNAYNSLLSQASPAARQTSLPPSPAQHLQQQSPFPSYGGASSSSGVGLQQLGQINQTLQKLLAHQTTPYAVAVDEPDKKGPQGGA